MAEEARPWHLLIHEIPSKPLYLRAKIRRLLEKTGAVALKDSVYLLPNRDGAQAELERVAAAAVSGGGDAFRFEARCLDARLERRLIDSFQRSRASEYEALSSGIRRWLARRQAASASASMLRRRLTHAQRRFDDIVRADFFGSPARTDAEVALAELASRAEALTAATPARRGALVGRIWVTRRGVQVDRIASAWFVRRFLDPRARFRFIDPGAADETHPGEIRFDMKDGDFTHEGEWCTFETLIARTGVRDPVLARVAEVVHDIDIKDGKFGRVESRGIEQLLRGILLSTPDDAGRLASGFALFDSLYHSFAPPPARS